jgi:hypothetical protein
MVDNFWNLFGASKAKFNEQGKSLSKIILQKQELIWWAAHKDSNLGPAD